ncbi:MAG: competence protein CoiA family protein [Verrucomicrobia bacterium]|nr:competence protein CoiA family protein [Verrucomicrobiota bacterium]
MFVALQTENGSRVTSIASDWDDRLGALRELAASGQLVCSGCRQLLWLRISRKRRRHFAHRHLGDCPLAHQSAELLEVKAQLFKWLETKYPGKVYLDMAIGVPGWDRLIDLLVEPGPGRKVAYWVFDRQQRSREEILAYQRLPGVHVHFIHTQSTLVHHSEGDIALTASQRDFITSSDYDACLAFGGYGHLHFLDGAESKLRIYRGLRCVHSPNLYGWEALRVDSLSEARISPKTGEIVLGGDVEARREQRQKLQQHKAVDLTARASAPPVLQGASRAEEEARPGEGSVGEQGPTAPPLNLKGPFRCEDCGVETMDWSEATPSAGTCVCRRCLAERWRRKHSPV